MITTMRANGAKVTKPPPPVPPRPSKNLVAEALAKSRKSDHGGANNNHFTNGSAGAPPVVKSQSYSAIYKFTSAPKIDHRVTTDEPPKAATRTLIYQSSNHVKRQATPKPQPLRNRVSSVEEIRVNVNRMESIKRECRPVMKTSSFKMNSKPPEVILLPADHTKVEERDSSLESLGDSEPISRSNSFKTDANNSSDSVISEDEGNWNNNDASDRNHVNTLIDEMFASVLELPDRREPVADGLEAPRAKGPDVVTIQTAVDSHDSRASPQPHQAHHADEDSKKTIVVIEPGRETPCKNAAVTPTAGAPTTASVNDGASAKHMQLQVGSESQRKIDDKFNHELLISELSSMKRERQIFKRQRNPSENSLSSPSSECKIQHSDWIEVNDGKEVRLSSCQITIEDDEKRTKQAHDIISRLEMANLPGLPPLPKSLSGFNIEGPPQTPASIGRPGTNRNPKNPASTNGELGSLKKPNNLDAKLALLRREMYNLRQLDLSLLSQLWSLNESIQDFRHMLQEQDERSILSPPSPSPTTSSGEDVDGDDYFQPSSMRFRLAPPPPPPHRRTSNSSSGTSSSV